MSETSIKQTLVAIRLSVPQGSPLTLADAMTASNPSPVWPSSNHPTLRGLLAGLALLLAQVASISAVGRDSPPPEPFAAAGISYAEAGVFLKRFQHAVRAHDVDAVAALTELPLIVNGKAGPKDRSEFARDFDAIYTAKVRAAVLTQTVDRLFASGQGLMIGQGEVWISALCDDDLRSGCKNRRIRIVSINNKKAMAPSNNWSGP